MPGKLFDDEQEPSNYDLFIGFLQFYDLMLNLNQTSNDTIFHELQRQNQDYLEKIIEQNKKIINLLNNKEG